MNTPYFRDRPHAGRELARLLAAYANRHDVIVLALPPGGVPVACEVAVALDAPLDVFIVGTLAAPGQPDYAVGAVASGGLRLLNDNVVRLLHIAPAVIAGVVQDGLDELRRCERFYRGEAPPPDLHERAVVLVDDGLASIATMQAAVKAVRSQGPARIAVTLPTATPETAEALGREADVVICAAPGRGFRSPNDCFEHGQHTSHDEARGLLMDACHGAAHAA